MKNENQRWTRRAVLGALVASPLLLTGCKGGLHFPNMISPSQEHEIGVQASEEIDRQNKLILSGPQYDQLQRVAGKIFPLAKQDLTVDYSVKLIDSKEVNAFALPGGPIYFYKGLMDIAGTDDEAAAVLGHESTHVVRHHVAKQISDAQMKGLLGQMTVGGASGLIQELASFGLAVDQLHYSRDDEAEADRNGFRYLVTAGYDPYAMSRMFRKLQAESGGDSGPL